MHSSRRLVSRSLISTSDHRTSERTRSSSTSSTELPKINDTCKVVLIVLVAIFASVGQIVGLPLYQSTFIKGSRHATGPYFVVFFCSVLFNLVFWPIVLFYHRRGSLDREWEYCFTKKGHLKLFFTGLFDALNGLLIVYSSMNSRVPGQLQPILLQSSIIFTVLGSKILLGKKYRYQQLGACALIAFGVAISLIPKFKGLATHGAKFKEGFIWPLIMVGGCIPGAGMNIAEESIFDDIPQFNYYFILAWESLYQVIIVGLLFWTDIIPTFGSSGSIQQFSENFAGGFGCFFGQESACDRAGWCMFLGLVFTASYVGTYVTSSVLMRFTSANFVAMIMLTASVCSIYFWVAFPSLNVWAGGDPLTTLDIATASGALVPIVLGAYFFRAYEPKTERELELLREGTMYAELASSSRNIAIDELERGADYEGKGGTGSTMQ